MTTKPFVSIIVLNWNGKRFIDPFFNSVSSLDYPKARIEVLFVDNNSSDGSAEYFTSKNIPNARLIQTGGNYGYAGGNNYGFKEAQGEFIAVCNNDLTLDSKWLSNLIHTAESTQADIVVPKIIDTHTNMIGNAGSMLLTDSDWPNTERGVGSKPNDIEFNKQAAVTAFCGASPLFRRSFLEEVGLFDSRFFLYWEDGDLSWRGQKHNKKYVYEPKAVVYHQTSGSTGGSNSPVFIYYVSRNRVLILIKNGKLTLALRAFLKVGRDHVLVKLRDLLRTVRSGQGRRQAARNLLLGVKIIGGIMYLTPIMLLKRWHIVQEEKI